MTQPKFDELDKHLLQLVQHSFPMVVQPWIEIGKKLNLTEEEVLARIRRLHENGVIRRIGPILDARKLGLSASTLVAMKVPKARIDAVAQIINQYENVSHNYEREHEYNIWFTVTAVDDEELTETLRQIKQRTRVNDDEVLELRTVQPFKADVRFKL